MKKYIKMTGILLTACALTACVQSYSGYTPKKNNASASNANLELGMSLLEKGNVDLAKSRLLSALKEDPNSSASWYAMAYFYEATGNEQLANQYYQKSIQVDPQNPMAHNNYGTYLCRHGKFEEAIKQFMTAVNQPDYIDTAQAYENAGLCSLLIPNDQWAMNYFQRALENKPSLPTSNLELAKLYYRQGNKRMAQYYLAEFNKLSKPTTESTKLADELGPSA